MWAIHPSPLCFSDISTDVHKTVSLYCAGTSKLALCSINKHYKRIINVAYFMFTQNKICRTLPSACSSLAVNT